MTTMRGRYVNGAIVLDGPAPVSWKDGQLVTVRTGNNAWDDDDEDRPKTPEEIDAMIREWDAIPALEFDEEEQKRFDEWQKKVGDYSKEAICKQFKDGIVGAP